MLRHGLTRWSANWAMSDVPITDAGTVADAAAAAKALVEVECLILDKLRLIAAGLEQDLSLVSKGARQCAPDGDGAGLAAALDACRGRITYEEALLAKLGQLCQGLVADVGWQRTSGVGGLYGQDPGAV
jgi:hypothetical protein